MSIASILAVVSGGKDSEAALQTALAAGRAFDAHVRVLHVMLDSTHMLPLLGEGMPAAMMSDLTASLAAEGTRTRRTVQQLFERHCRDAGVPIVPPEEVPPPRRFTVTLSLIDGSEPETVAEEGRLHDLIVLGRAPLEEGSSGPTLEAALFDTGRPVLVAPRQALTRMPTRIAVAWNGTREAARAVALTLPILERAREVVVITGEGKDDRPVAHPNALLRYLRLRNIGADTWQYQPEDWPVSTSLMEQAKKAGAGLLVMGAYGHSRLRELVLGGATRAALRAGELAVLMVH